MNKHNRLYNDLIILYNFLENNGFRKEKCEVTKLLKISYLDYPIEEIEIETKEELFEHLKDNPGIFINLDNPLGSTKSFGDNSKKMTFHYGEWPELINPADDMGWDVVIVPSSSGISKSEEVDGEEGDATYIPTGHDLVPVGYVPVNPSRKDWTDKASKSPPIGNDKIILSADGQKPSEGDMKTINNFFSDLWQFSEIVWF